MRLPRFRIRTLMVAVAVVAIVIANSLAGGTWMRQRAGVFRALALRHWQDAERCTSRGTVVDARSGRSYHVYQPTPWSDYHTRMTEKYERAARYPFLPVAPDPPVPE